MTTSRSRTSKGPSKGRGRARNGQGTVTPRKLSDGTTVYDAKTPKVFDPDAGKERRIPRKGFKTEAEASQWIATTMTGLRNGERIRERRGGPTVGEVVEPWAKASTLKPSTIAGHLNMLRLMGGELMDEPIGKVRSTDLDLFLSGLLKRYKPTTVALLCRALVNIWDYAIRAGLTSVNAVRESPWVSKIYQMVRDDRAERVLRKEEESEEGLIKVFTPEQTNTLLSMERRKDYRRIWEFIVKCGTRRGETVGLRWSDVDLEKGMVWLSDNVVYAGGKIMTVDTPKGNRRRRIFIAPEVIDLLQEQKRAIEEAKAKFGEEWKDHDLVFPRMFRPRGEGQVIGGHLDPQSLTEVFSRRCRTLGLPEITLHGLRHTWASTAYAAGVDIKTIQKHLGHRFDITTLVYIHTDSDTQKEAVVRVVDHLRVA